MAREQYLASLEVHVADPERHTFSAFVSAFGNLVGPQPPSMMPTFIMPGAFNKTLKDRAGKILIKHQHSETIGKLLDGYESDRGLQITGMISETQRGLDTRTLMLDRVLTEMSIGFEVVPKRVEYLSGKELIERLANLNLNREVASLIRNKIDEYGTSEKYRVIGEVKLYEVSVVDEGADSMTAIQEVNHAAAAKNGTKEDLTIQKKDGKYCLIAGSGKSLGCYDTIAEAKEREREVIAAKAAKGKQAIKTFTREELMAMSPADVMLSIHEMSQAVADMCADYTDMPEGDTPDGNYAMWICAQQAKAYCAAMMTLLDMPVMMPMQSAEAQESNTSPEQRVGRKISAARMGLLKDHMKSLKSMYKILRELISSAEPPTAPDPAKGKDAQALSAEPQTSALLIERRRKIREARLRIYQKQITGVLTNGSSGTITQSGAGEV